MISEIIQTITSLIVLTCLEIILSIDNIIFISLVCEFFDKKRKKVLKQIGVTLAVSVRILLLLSLNWLTHISYPLFTIYNFRFTLKDITMVSGGIYLILFSTIKLFEIIKHKKSSSSTKANSFMSAIVVILFGDSLFSFDSVLAAITIGHNIATMIFAILFASIFLLFSVTYVSNFIEKYSNIKVLALIFLLLIGISLTSSGFHYNFSSFQLFITMSFVLLAQLLTLKNQANKIK